jgi:hypothetical protein
LGRSQWREARGRAPRDQAASSAASADHYRRPLVPPVGLFGEAAINLPAAGVFPAGTCEAFGSAFLKSRASTAFRAEVKDFIAPQPVNISNCGRVKIVKRTDPRGINQNFGFTSTIPDGGATSCVSDATPSSFTLNDNGNTSSDSAGNTEDCIVLAGSYTVTEGSEPPNFVLESLSCRATTGSSGTQNGTTPAQADITVAPGGLVTCVYVNKQQLGAIKGHQAVVEGQQRAGRGEIHRQGRRR